MQTLTLTKEQFKKNVDEVINRPKGVSEYGDCKYFHVRVRPDDYWLKINIVFFGQPKDYVQQILDSIPDEYRDHLTGIKKGGCWDDSYELTFDEQAQEAWNTQLHGTIENYYNMYHNL